jgi:hypothetical protein
VGDRIRIDDLAEPRYTDIQDAALAYGERHHVDLQADAVMAAAVVRTGLEEFGAQDYVERLDLWLTEMDRDADRTGLGRLGFFNDCVRYASNRLQIRDLLERHPEILEVRIERPIIVVGLPRSGTTHLVNLIAADQRLRSMPLWESYEPVPDPRESPGPDGVDPRWQRCQGAWEATQLTLPYLSAMHPMHPDHVHEELELELPDFSSYTPEWVARCPQWRDYYLSHDQTPHYRYLRTVLQILQWTRPGERWVLKSPQHLEQLGPLLATFPDATVVVTHRDPVSVIQSAATMMTYAARMGYRHPRPEFYIEYWNDRIRRLLRSSVRDRHLVPDERSVDVLFHEFMRDDLATVERIYAVAGLALTDEARSQLTRYRDDHRRGLDGQVIYDLRADFGVTPEDVREPFGFYFDRFEVRAEVS